MLWKMNLYFKKWENLRILLVLLLFEQFFYDDYLDFYILKFYKWKNTLCKIKVQFIMNYFYFLILQFDKFYLL